MESSRDSSIWRSLAVAFGDGLAFGVGMKLTQNAGRQAAAPGLEDNTLNDRLEALERRLARMERNPAALPQSPSAPAQVQFDQKVLEAVVNALEARLKEQAGHMERRLAELDAKITIELKALDRQGRSLEGRIAALDREALADLPKSVQAVEAKLDERTSLLHQVEQRVEAVESHVAGLDREALADLPKSVQAVEARLDERTSLLRQVEGRVDAVEDLVTGLDRELITGLPKSVQAVEAMLDERTSLLHQVERRVNTVEDRFAGFRAELMEALPKAVDEQGRAIKSQVENLVNAVEDRIVAMHHELAAGVEARAIEVSRKITETAVAAVDSVVEPKFAATRTALEQRSREVAELRRLLEESNQRYLELLLAISQSCRQAAQNISPPAPPEAAAAAGASATTADPSTESAAEGSDPDVPGFAQSKPPARILKLPLVSSMIVSVGLGSLLLFRFL